jgi:hypothetical protein
MFEFELKHLAAAIIGIGVVLRPHLLNRLKHNDALGNSVYFILIIVLVTPMYMYKFTFTSLDDNTAKQLVEKVLTFDPFSDYKRPSNIIWKAYDEKKSLYNIQADVFNDARPYRLFLQPECHFFKGCEVAVDRIMLFPKNHAGYDIESLTAEKFEKRICSDVLVESILKKDRLPNAIKLLFKEMKAKTDSSTSYRIRSISLNDYKETDTPYSAAIDSNVTLKNSCEAKFKLEGDFSIVYSKDKREYAPPILKTLFDNVTNKGKSFSISSSVKYGIYMTPKKEITVVAQPFNVAKFQKIRESASKAQQQTTDKKIQRKFAKAKKDDTQTKLNLAVNEQNFERVRELVESGYDVNKRGKVGYTPLMSAAGMKNFKIVQYLVEHGADINARLRSGWSVLHRAAMSKNPKILRYLIKKGIRMDVKDRYGCTPMDSAFRNNALQRGGSLENAKTLIENGLSVNRKCRSYTPLMISVPDYDVSKFLIDNGANKLIKNQFGKTAYDMAKQQSLSKAYLQLLKP